MAQLDLAGKRVMIREDLNVPLHEGQVVSDARIRAALPTIQLALQQGARVMLLSHLGRPVEGQYDAALSLAPVAARLSSLLGCSVPLVRDWLDGVEVAPGSVVLCENVRFNKGEKKDDPALAQRMASARRIAGGRVLATDIEARLGTRFTVDTLARLRRRFPLAWFVLLVGADIPTQLPRWKHQLQVRLSAAANQPAVGGLRGA